MPTLREEERLAFAGAIRARARIATRDGRQALTERLRSAGVTRCRIRLKGRHVPLNAS